MNGIRIQFRYLGFGQNAASMILPGEPVYDPVAKRMGVGYGGFNANWFPQGTPEGNLQFDIGQGLVSSNGTYSLKFSQTGLSWTVSGQEMLATRDTNGIAIRQGVMMRNSTGVNVVVMGYGHYVALMALLRNLKALLRKFVAGTATNTDVNGLLTPDPTLDFTALDPSFPDAGTL